MGRRQLGGILATCAMSATPVTPFVRGNWHRRGTARARSARRPGAPMSEPCAQMREHRKSVQLPGSLPKTPLTRGPRMRNTTTAPRHRGARRLGAGPDDIQAILTEAELSAAEFEATDHCGSPARVVSALDRRLRARQAVTAIGGCLPETRQHAAAADLAREQFLARSAAREPGPLGGDRMIAAEDLLHRAVRVVSTLARHAGRPACRAAHRHRQHRPRSRSRGPRRAAPKATADPEPEPSPGDRRHLHAEVAL